MLKHGSQRLLHASVLGPMRASLGRTFLSIMAIALGVALGFAIYTMNRAAVQEVEQATRSLFGEADLIVTGTSAGFDERLYPLIARVTGVALASPALEMNARVIGSTQRLTVLGLDLLREARMQATTAARDEQSRTGLWFFDADNLMLSAPAARALGLGVNDTLTLQVGVKPVTFTIRGVLPDAAYSGSIALMDIAAAQWRLDFLGKLNRIHVRLLLGVAAGNVAAEIQQLLPANVKVTTPTAEVAQSRQLTVAFTTNLTALALVSLFTGGFLIYSTQALAVMRRRREFAILHAIGFTRRQQKLAIISTGALLGMTGALLGVLLGAALARSGLRIFLGSLGARGDVPDLQFTTVEVIGFVTLGLLVATVGSLAPAAAAARVPTAQALKAGNAEQRHTFGHAYGGLALWALAPLVLLLPPLLGLPLPGYVAIALILFGAVLLIPSITQQLLARLPTGHGAIYQTALAQLRGTAHASTVSVSSILVSVSLMVAMAIMIASLRGSYIESINRMLPADIYVTAGRHSDAAYLDTAMVDTLRHMDGVQRSAAARTTEILLDPAKPPVTLVARPIALDRPQDSLIIETHAERPPPANTVPIWVSVAMVDLYGVSVDDVLPFMLGNVTVNGSVRGLWRDNSTEAGSIAMDIEQYREISGDERTDSLGLWAAPDSSPEQLLTAIRARMPADVSIELGAPGDIRARQLQGFDRVFAVTYVLLAVAVIIGLFGIGVSASAQALARRAEFGVLRHLGFTQRQIGRLLALEGLVLGMLGMIGSLLVGGVIALVLIHVVGRQSFHWSMDLHVPYRSLLALCAVVPLAAGLTALWSGRAAMNPDVVRAVKEDW